MVSRLRKGRTEEAEPDVAPGFDESTGGWDLSDRSADRTDLDDETETEYNPDSTGKSDEEDADWHDRRLSARGGGTRSPQLTVRPNGGAIVNRSAIIALGDPERILVGYSPTWQAILLRATTEDDERGYRVVHGKRARMTTVSLRALLSKHGVALPKLGTAWKLPGKPSDDGQTLSFDIFDV